MCVRVRARARARVLVCVCIYNRSAKFKAQKIAQKRKCEGVRPGARKYKCDDQKTACPALHWRWGIVEKDMKRGRGNIGLDNKGR